MLHCCYHPSSGSQAGSQATPATDTTPHVKFSAESQPTIIGMSHDNSATAGRNMPIASMLLLCLHFLLALIFLFLNMIGCLLQHSANCFVL